VPESFMDEIIEVKPSHVLLIDAAMLGLQPGAVRLYDVEKLNSLPSISTHTLPLRVFCDYINQMAKTKIALLLVEPKNTEFGEGLSPEVAVSALRIARFLLTLLP